MSRLFSGLAALALALDATGCGGNADPECAQKVERLRDAMVAVGRESTILDGRFVDIDLPMAAVPAEGSLEWGGHVQAAGDARALERLRGLIALSKGHVELDGRDLGPVDSEVTVANLEKDLTQLAGFTSVLHPERELRVYVFAAKATTIASIRPFLLVAARRFAVRLVVSPSNALRPPKAPPGSADFERKWKHAAKVEDRAALLGAEIARSCFPCDLRPGISAAVHSPPEDRTERLILAVTKDLRGCSCTVRDFDALAYALALGMDANRSCRRRSIPLPLDPTSDGTFGLGADATLDELVKKLTTGTGSPKHVISAGLPSESR